MHALSPCKGPVEIIFNFNQSSLAMLWLCYFVLYFFEFSARVKIRISFFPIKNAKNDHSVKVVGCKIPWKKHEIGYKFQLPALLFPAWNTSPNV